MTKQSSTLQPFVEGKLNIRSVGAVYDSTLELGDGEGVLDLARLQSVDSAGLALLVSWKLRFPGLAFVNIPDSVRDIAKLSNTHWVFES